MGWRVEYALEPNERECLRRVLATTDTTLPAEAGKHRPPRWGRPFSHACFLRGQVRTPWH